MTKNKKKGFVLAYGSREIKSINGKEGKEVEAESRKQKNHMSSTHRKQREHRKWSKLINSP